MMTTNLLDYIDFLILLKSIKYSASCFRVPHQGCGNYPIHSREETDRGNLVPATPDRLTRAPSDPPLT